MYIKILESELFVFQSEIITMLRSRQLRSLASAMRQLSTRGQPSVFQNKISIPQSCNVQKRMIAVQPNELRKSWPAPAFNLDKMTELLDHDNHEMRKQFRQFVSDPIMIPKYNISLAEEREVALQRLKRICDAGFLSVLDFNDNPLRIFAAHELAAIIDAAMATKMTVQFNLFGGTVLKLGTERHHKKLLKGRTNKRMIMVYIFCTLRGLWGINQFLLDRKN